MRYATAYRCLDTRQLDIAVEPLTPLEQTQLQEVWIVPEVSILEKVPLIHNKTGRMLDKGHDWFIVEVGTQTCVRAYTNRFRLLLVFEIEDVQFCTQCGKQLPHGFDQHFHSHDCTKPQLTKD